MKKQEPRDRGAVWLNVGAGGRGAKVDLRPLKEAAARLLPEGHELRLEIQAAPDEMYAEAAAPTLEYLLRVVLAFRDLGSSGDLAALGASVGLTGTPFHDGPPVR